MNIQEIKLKDSFTVIFSDSHCNLKNIRLLQELYPNKLLLSLGDICQLFSKPGEPFNSLSIQFFINNKIPSLLSNHEQHILQCSIGDSFTKIMPKYSENCGSSICDLDVYDLTQQEIDFLKNLPIGFKLILPNKKYYLLYHHAPKDLWGFNDQGKLTEKQFKDIYQFNEDCLGVIHGHTHRNFTEEYPNIKTKRFSIGQLCNSDHHTGKENGKNYLLLTENGLEYKKL